MSLLVAMLMQDKKLVPQDGNYSVSEKEIKLHIRFVKKIIAQLTSHFYCNPKSVVPPKIQR